jgi:polyphosphate glucokinase
MKRRQNAFGIERGRHDQTPSESARKSKNARLKILVIDIKGTQIKILVTGTKIPRKVSTGHSLTAGGMVEAVKKLAGDWKYDAVSLGYPGLVVHGRPVLSAPNLGPGWIGFNFAFAFKRPVKVINAAAMEALGAYNSGSLLFLGLGPGMSSSMVVDGIAVPMELAQLEYKKATFEDYVGTSGLKKHGKKRWRRHILDVFNHLKSALEPDEVVLGGKNVDKLKKFPPHCRPSNSMNIFTGGFRIWGTPDPEPQPAIMPHSKVKQRKPTPKSVVLHNSPRVRG